MPDARFKIMGLNAGSPPAFAPRRLAAAIRHLAIAGLAWSAAAGGATPPRDPAAPGAAPATPVARIQFDAPVFDFGRVAAGTVVDHDYAFTNAGPAPLVVTGVYPSCDCTVVGRWSALVEAGHSGSIPVRFDSAGYGGAIDKWIIVASSDPARPQVKLVFRGTVAGPIDVSPPNVTFTPAAGATGRETRVIRITNHTGEPLALAAPECASRAFAVELQTVRPGEEFELRVTLVPPIGPGPVRGFITIKTNSVPVPVIAVMALALAPPPAAAATGRQEDHPSPTAR